MGNARVRTESMCSSGGVLLIVEELLRFPIFFQLAVESGLTDAEQLRSHQLVPV